MAAIVTLTGEPDTGHSLDNHENVNSINSHSSINNTSGHQGVVTMTEALSSLSSSTKPNSQPLDYQDEHVGGVDDDDAYAVAERLDQSEYDQQQQDNAGDSSDEFMSPSYNSRSPSNNNNNSSMSMSQEKYSMMMKMTLELVQDLTSVREGDAVYTAFGEGICIQKHSTRNPSMQVALRFGTLYHREPEMVHKLLDANTYSEAMDHLDQVRKLQWTMRCEQWNVSLVGQEQDCVACLFDKPHWKGQGTTSSNNATSTRTPWYRRMNKNNNNNNNKISNNNNSSTFRQFHKHSAKHKSCDVCGNPVCAQHTIGHQSNNAGTNFIMCVDCQFDLTNVVQQKQNNSSSSAKGLLDPNHPQLPQTLDRLLQYYTRMVLQLQFWVPNATKELSRLLTDSERNNAKVALGTGSLSFVGAALGVAGAAALMTPAGPAILLAAVATSATSATIQGTHAGVNRYRLKSSTSQLSHVHGLSDRLLGWHGLCLGILQVLEELRFQLLCEHEAVLRVLEEQQRAKNAAAADAQRNGGAMADSKKSKILPQHRRPSKLLGSGRTSRSSNKALEVWNTLAVGSFHTTRHGLTGVVRSIIGLFFVFVPTIFACLHESHLVVSCV